MSPHLEQSCLRLSANMSYEQTAVDLEYITGVQSNAMSQQRLVHRQEFQLPVVTALIEELCVDGGKVRLRTDKGKNSGLGKGNERRHCKVTRMGRNSLTEKSHRRTSLKATSLNDTE